jgi:uncharacterized membrane protein YdbT with pleckstrin-like domain
MTVIPLPSATRIGTGSQPYTETTAWVEPRHLATNTAGLVHHETAPLLSALEHAVAAAAAEGVNDTGARRAADDLRRARIALDFAITAAGRALADREVRIRRAS